VGGRPFSTEVVDVKATSCKSSRCDHETERGTQEWKSKASVQKDKS